MWFLALIIVGVPLALAIWASKVKPGQEAGEYPGAPRARGRAPALRMTAPFAVRGRPGEVKTDHDDRMGGWCTARVDMRGHSPGAFIIHRSGILNRIDPVFGDQDIQIGDRRFDQTYVIKAHPVDLAQRLFSVERRAEVMAAVRRHEPNFLKVELTRETLEVREWGHRYEVAAEVDSVLRTASDFTRFILDLEGGTGVLWLGEAEIGVGQCQVCGTEMSVAVVECAKCRTPHHEECWRYLGMCSTFACKEKAYRVEGRRITAPPPPRPEPPARRQRPDEWMSEEMNRDIRNTGGVPLRDVPAVDESLRRFEQRQRERGQT